MAWTSTGDLALLLPIRSGLMAIKTEFHIPRTSSPRLSSDSNHIKILGLAQLFYSKHPQLLLFSRSIHSGTMLTRHRHDGTHFRYTIHIPRASQPIMLSKT
ncbi:hypothetical protein RP20_CCG011067 [Aedes albopictus]|nr:hypothetical protein RP20_CCG011067 [Aedes albopictus]